MKDYSVTIEPLTPIWTGDAQRKGDTLRETGIIGSLRWWYEALIRGLGGSACDPTSKNCNGQNHCAACELFGCTGWARKFRLEIENNNINPIPVVSIGTREKKKNRYLKRNISGLMSNKSIILRFIPLKEISLNEWVLLNTTFKIIDKYGTIGAHTSQGSGVIQIVENSLPSSNELCAFDSKKNKDNSESPNLDKFFFYKFQIKFSEDLSKLIEKEVFWTHASDNNNFKDDWKSWEILWTNYHFLPIASHVRDAIRHLEQDRNKRHEIFGIGGGNAKGSKVFVSHGYKIDKKTIEVRVWGYNVDQCMKNRIKNQIRSMLEEKLFSSHENRKKLEECILTEEKEGSKLLEELK